jgi:hypothetical protein
MNEPMMLYAIMALDKNLERYIVGLWDPKMGNIPCVSSRTKSINILYQFVDQDLKDHHDARIFTFKEEAAT